MLTSNLVAAMHTQVPFWGPQMAGHLRSQTIHNLESKNVSSSDELGCPGMGSGASPLFVAHPVTGMGRLLLGPYPATIRSLSQAAWWSSSVVTFLGMEHPDILPLTSCFTIWVDHITVHYMAKSRFSVYVYIYIYTIYSQHIFTCIIYIYVCVSIYIYIHV